jgi:hypothetical protein
VVLMLGAAWGTGTGVVAAHKSPDPMQQKSPDPLLPSPSSPSAAQGGLPSLDSDIPNDPIRGRMKEDRVKALNIDRHKRLEDDVNRLMALTTELKTEVDKSNKDELSLEVMRKAAEIEKLAHEVQSRMKN